MTDPVFLIKENPLLPAEDFASLRKEGIKYIEQTGSYHWTDYNTSDPGITMLEAVCYAITDLAYRTGFDVKDLLTPEHIKEDPWKQIFYTARQILHNKPLTITDYRKLLIDIKGVRNAWIEPSKNYEVPVWVDYNYSRLDPRHDCACKEEEPVECKGKLGLRPVKKENVLEDKKEFLKQLQAEIDSTNEKIKEAKENKDKSKNLKALQRNVESLKKLKTKIENEISEIQNDAKRIIESKIVEFEGLYNVMIEYEEDVLEEKQRDDVRASVYKKLLRNRNLCEDFLSVNAVEYEDFGLGTTISIAEYADPDVILSKIFFIVFKYFTPSVPFYTIHQMMENGFSIDEIFEGPALDHGFINSEDIEKTELFRDIRLSDILSEISDIDGVKAITYFHLPFTDFNKPGSGSNYFLTWLQHLKDERKIARIRPDLSRVIFCKEREVITYNTNSPTDRRPNRMLHLFRNLKALERKYKLELPDTELDLPVPSGSNMELEDYYPVTYSLPMCYGVSERAGLPAEADEKRQVQALQLKGYLLFFEQLLADYLVQLNHLRDIFTFDDTVKHTYFTNVLTGVDDLRSLLIDYADHGDDECAWKDILKDFTNVLHQLVETPKLFYERRNIFLDHMLARFSEDLTEYEDLSRWLTPDSINERLVKDKIRILKDGEYYKISSRRGAGYDYSQRKIWDTPNVSGAERRLSRLLGFANADRKILSTKYVIIEPADEHQHHHHDHHKKKKNIIKLVDPDDGKTALLTSVKVKDGCCTGQLVEEILEHADDRRFFVFRDGDKPKNRNYEESAGPFSFALYDDTDKEKAVLLAWSEEFEKIEDRNGAYRKLRKLMEKINDNEGLYLVEHLLLRPRIDETHNERDHEMKVKFPDICLDACDLGIGLDDGTEPPLYRKRIYRIPPEKCFDNMPWVLEYIRIEDGRSILFQRTFPDNQAPVDLKFRRYESLAKRIRDLQQFGSEKINYKIVSNEKVQASQLKYKFIIYGSKGEELAHSPYIFDQKKDHLVVNPVDIDEEIEKLTRYFGYELDFYCEANPCDNNEDPFSFRTTAIFPCWPKRFRDHSFRNLVEKTIQKEFPAHIHTRVVWIGLQEMRQFEHVYEEWLKEMTTDLPQIRVVNSMVHLLDTIKPCGCCEDECDHHYSHEHQDEHDDEHRWINKPGSNY